MKNSLRSYRVSTDAQGGEGEERAHELPNLEAKVSKKIWRKA
jgi:hypothetical protein